MTITDDDQSDVTASHVTRLENVLRVDLNIAQSDELWDMAPTSLEWTAKKAAPADLRDCVYAKECDHEHYDLLVVAGDCEPEPWPGPYTWDVMNEVGAMPRDNGDDDGIYWCHAPEARPIDVEPLCAVDLAISCIPEGDQAPPASWRWGPCMTDPTTIYLCDDTFIGIEDGGTCVLTNRPHAPEWAENTITLIPNIIDVLVATYIDFVNPSLRDDVERHESTVDGDRD